MSTLIEFALTKGSDLCLPVVS